MHTYKVKTRVAVITNGYVSVEANSEEEAKDFVSRCYWSGGLIDAEKEKTSETFRITGIEVSDAERPRFSGLKHREDGWVEAFRFNTFNRVIVPPREKRKRKNGAKRKRKNGAKKTANIGR